MTEYQTKAITLLFILFLCFFAGMCKSHTGTTKERAYGLLSILSAVLIMGVVKL